TATIELERDGQSFRESATAEGPCDAAFRAIDRITGTPGTVVDFSVHSVSAGADSTAEVSIRAQFQGKEFTGKSLSYNVIEAAARAYLQAANKGVYEIRRTVGHATAGGRSIHENELVDRLFPGGY
ncbi:MAG TPA: alpha-isopropylmalate synthase regulatory domain-containing protein, partial [Terriglobia bacterium]|nr:alpha-isopropylmalate synthase regulatory domain-containing protein [Terriglobia bacterium]